MLHASNRGANSRSSIQLSIWTRLSNSDDRETQSSVSKWLNGCLRDTANNVEANNVVAANLIRGSERVRRRRRKKGVSWDFYMTMRRTGCDLVCKKQLKLQLAHPDNAPAATRYQSASNQETVRRRWTRSWEHEEVRLLISDVFINKALRSARTHMDALIRVPEPT